MEGGLARTLGVAVPAAGCCVHVEEAPGAKARARRGRGGLVPGGSTVLLGNGALPGGPGSGSRIALGLRAVQLADILASYLGEEGVMGCRILLDRVGRARLA